VAADGAFFPSIIILGTPKSGTSSLHEWLCAHPEIGEGSEKELRFLLDAEEPLARPNGYAVTGVEGYGAFFPARATARKTHWVDSSPTYYYQCAAMDAVSARSDAPFLGLLFRQPGPRIHSYYQYAMQNRGVLPADMTFESFVKAAEEGASGPLRATPGLANVLEHSNYAKYTKLWLDRVPRDRFFFQTFDELVSNPRAVVRHLCLQFGVDPAIYDTYDFPQENRSLQVKNSQLHFLKERVARHLKAPPAVRRALRGLYERMNTAELRREKDDRTKALIAELNHRFAPGLPQLEDLTGLDLSAWRV
jgi:hypothetical protein